ncbi:MAG: serine hydrolase [Clostridia bacterium]|nr:serine hydrolase [Clostridia bacterium]
MDYSNLIRDLQALHLNLYDLALYTPKGIQTYRFQPGSNCSNSYSVAKVFIVTALGILWDEGRWHPDDPICWYLDLPADAEPRWKDVTIEHAITHRIGFDEGFLDIDSDDPTSYPTQDYLSMVFSHPLVHAPGTHEQYSDAAYYLLSRLITSICGERTDTFLHHRILQPLGFHEAAWSRCPQDYPIGATGLYISSEDMVKLGALYLQSGVWQGQRLLSREWTDMLLGRGYELTPLSPDVPGCTLIGKWGMYGQLLALSPERQLALAIHAHMRRSDSNRLGEYLSRL